jgi:DHA1 family tetracycline resistance protein-like MFS transporter
MPALLVMTATLAKGRPGKFFGILRGSQGLSFIAGPALGSLFSLISLRAPFMADAIISLVAFLAAFVLVRDTEKEKPGHKPKLLEGLQATFSTKNIYLFLLMGITGLFAFGILETFIPTRAQLNGLQAWEIGLILSAGAVVFSIVSFTVGPFSDKYGRSKFVIVAQLIIAGAIAGLIFSDSFLTMMGFFMLFSLGETTTFLLCFVYASEAFDERYMGTSMAAFDSMIDLSLFLGPMLTILVYNATGQLATVFIIAAVPAVMAFFVLSFRLR